MLNKPEIRAVIESRRSTSLDPPEPPSPHSSPQYHQYSLSPPQHQRSSPLQYHCPPSPCASPGISDADTVYNALKDAYSLGYAEGRIEGRNDALRLGRSLRQIGTITPFVEACLSKETDDAAPHGGDATLVEPEPESPPRYRDIPNTNTSRHLTPKTRKRIALELPPSPLLRKKVKSYRSTLELGLKL
ncbi:uncharacterized protein TRAVEDRAFT_42961 [Trametes versicolor FP-101664 SS1]|uniref:uncharacterized protein n=1 Tax=Trametes versicolor (strain FP-101664) TaxID=717944 RepID=UPI0004622562|nr:uncharacterized protein TRAVEDRAFT_42961 [Trametes versicolor FP-101664 SS1]EIW62611.1 hypothetical protein TRAVEDRAFT_42961 [Trametes versicolor FP-101664 SS1]